MKKTGIIITILLLSVTASAQSIMASFAIRGGGNMYLVNGNVSSKMGYQGMLDFGYHMYFRAYQTEVGFKTGVSVGYATANFTGNFHRTFTNVDYLLNEWQYTVDAPNINLNSQQVIIEVPAMFALRRYDFFFNVGAKLMIPMYNTYTQTIDDGVVDAYFEPTNVHVINRLITGDLTHHVLTGRDCLPKFNILAGIETGYEWTLENNDRIGLGVYADVAPWCSKVPNQSSGDVIEVAPIINPAYPPAAVTVRPLSCEMGRMMMADFGVKIYYGLNYLNKAALGLHW